MEWLDILGLGASAASGGLFGVLGAAFGAWMKLKERRQKAVEQEAQRAHELKLIELHQQETSQEGAWAGLKTSIEAEAALAAATTNMPIVQAIKSLFRPFLTISLWLLVGGELLLVHSGYLSSFTMNSENNTLTLFSQDEFTALVKYIVYSTVFSATTATTWWFGERALSLPETKNR